jgi:hypothetical protein
MAPLLPQIKITGIPARIDRASLSTHPYFKENISGKLLQEKSRFTF